MTSFIGIDIGTNTIRCTKFIYKPPQSYGYENCSFKGSTAIPFSLLYEQKTGATIAESLPADAYQTNYFPSLSYFLSKSLQEIIDESRGKNYRFKVRYVREESSGEKEQPLFVINMHNTAVEKTVQEILSDYFGVIVNSVIPAVDKEKESKAYFAVVTLHKMFKPLAQKLIFNALYKAGFKSSKFISNEIAGFLGGVNLLTFSLENESQYLHVNFGRSELCLSLIRYKDNDFEIVEKEFNKNLGGQKIDETIKELFIEQINEQDPFLLEEHPNLLDTASQEAKIFFSRITEKQAFYKKNFYDVLLYLDKETYEEILLKQVIEQFKKTLLGFSKFIKKYLIDLIVCVGGTSNILSFQRILEIIFNKQVVIMDQPEMALARGAAFLCAKYFSIYRLKQFELISDVQTYKAVPYSLGIATANELLDFTVMHFIVLKGTPLPLDSPKSVTLKTSNHPKFKVTLLEGECIVSKQNKVLHECEINLDSVHKDTPHEIRIEISIEDGYIITFRVHVDQRMLTEKFKHLPDLYFFDKIQPKELETEKVKKRTVRAKIADLIKRIETRYKSYTNLQLKKRMEHIYQKACDYKVYAKETKFELPYLTAKLAELEKL